MQCPEGDEAHGPAPRKRRTSKEVAVESMSGCTGLVLVGVLVTVSVMFAATFAAAAMTRLEGPL